MELDTETEPRNTEPKEQGQMAIHKTHKATAEGKARTQAQKARRAAKYMNTGPINVQSILSAQKAKRA